MRRSVSSTSPPSSRNTNTIPAITAAWISRSCTLRTAYSRKMIKTTTHIANTSQPRHDRWFLSPGLGSDSVLRAAPELSVIRFKQPLLQCVLDYIRPMMQVQLLHQAPAIGFNSLVADKQHLTDLAAGETAGRVSEDFALAFTQQTETVFLLMPVHVLAAIVFHEDVCRIRVQVGLPLRNLPDRVNEVGVCRAFQYVARCSTLDHLDDVLLVRVHCQHQHFRVQMLGGNFCDSVQPIHIRHRQIHYDDVRREPGNLVDGLVPVSRFSDDFQIRFCVQQGAQAGAQYGMVICQHDPYLLHHTFISSTTVPTAASAVIRVPEPGLDAMWNVPPMSSMRSAMPIRPRPCPSFRSTCAGSKPCPLSVMINRSTSGVCSSVTSTCVAPACLATFDSAS